jgi:protein-L-isoaspartate(D-aspartate) O-methyltransferase
VTAVDALDRDRAGLVQMLAARGIEDRDVLRAFGEVPRHRFLPQGLSEFAYRDIPLPIGEGQTISQPYVVAWMTEAAGVKQGRRVLEVGTGSGYAAAIASRIAAEVFSIERHGVLAEGARRLLEELGYRNVHVLHGDGTRGWPEHAPFDAILVAAGGPSVPPALLEQLAPGGTLVMPVGPADAQTLFRIRRRTDGALEREELGDVRFVPLVGEHGWAPVSRVSERGLVALLGECAEPIEDVESAELEPLLERIGTSRVVLLGESTHGTHEFYRMRARISRALIEHHGFRAVAVEADWPDAARVDRYARHLPPASTPWKPFSRFPTWMWRNEEVRLFAEWMRAYNGRVESGRQAGFYGLDLYSLFTSAEAVLSYLDRVDPDAARVARARYGLLTPWQADPAAYGRAVVSGRFESCETEVVQVLVDLLSQRLDYQARDGESFFDASQNARVVADAEAYYRAMYRGNVASWNLRDRHMTDTLSALLKFLGPEARVVVWAHNSHVGDATATEMGAIGEHTLGQLCRERFGSSITLVGFGTDHGTVVAATNWGEPHEVKRVRPADPRSYEGLCHRVQLPNFLLPLRQPRRAAVQDELTAPRLERAIGVIYRPETELQSHYFRASLPRQFDEWFWLDRTSALRPLGGGPPEPGLPETYPFGL